MTNAGGGGGNRWSSAACAAPSLVNFTLCFHLDIPAIEKQTLLEARGARHDCLFDVLTFKLEERKLGGPGPHGGPSSVQ